MTRTRNTVKRYAPPCEVKRDLAIKGLIRKGADVTTAIAVSLKKQPCKKDK